MMGNKKELDVYEDVFTVNEAGERVQEAQVVLHVSDVEAARNFIGSYAAEHNYGIYRKWNVNGKYYFDCGPRTFYTLEDINL